MPRRFGEACFSRVEQIYLHLYLIILSRSIVNRPDSRYPTGDVLALYPLFLDRRGNMSSGNFTKLYVDQLKDLYNAETQLTAALPKPAKAASTPALQEAFQMHLAEIYFVCA